MSYHVSSRAMSTLPIVLAAISHYHSRCHYPTPTTSRSVTRALEGAKRTFGKPSVPAKIFTASHLTTLSSKVYSPSCSLVFLRTVWRVFIKFFGLLRFNEVANLTFDDISWHSNGFDLHIRKSKTDQHSKGDFVSIVKNKNPALCPVSLTLYYFNKLSIKSDYLMPTFKG